jgi:ADP-heptose:LPS heptosyltransferase
MDLVITVDTSIVHLAGALGKATWLLLPHRYEWRWSLEGESNNWYDSVHVIRQQAAGDWDGVLATVFGTRLRNWVECFEEIE